MSSVDLDLFGQLSVFLIERKAYFLLPSKLDRCPNRRAQLDNFSNHPRPASGAAYGPTMKYISELKPAAAQPRPKC